MKALSLWEPWASLMAVGVKTIETRSFPTNYRGELAIHASKRFTREQRETLRSDPFWRSTPPLESIVTNLGHILCIVDLYDCKPTEYLIEYGLPVSLEGKNTYEYEFGNYEPGRWGWLTKDVRRLARPLPVVGRQGLFNAPIVECDNCDGVGLMEGWNRRDGHPCPKCWGDGIMLGL